MNNCPFTIPCKVCTFYNPAREYPCKLDEIVFEDQKGNKIRFDGSYPGLSRVQTEVFDNETLELLAGFNEDTV